MLKNSIFTLLILFSISSYASSYECKHNTLVHDGDSTSVVRIKCGSPIKENYLDSGIEKWTYDQGYGKLKQIYFFQNGVLIKVEMGSRSDKNNISPNKDDSGCCSSHGGMCGCENNKIKCCDGIKSPSCGC